MTLIIVERKELFKEISCFYALFFDNSLLFTIVEIDISL